MNNKQIMLVVLDGWGYRKEQENNSIVVAEKPNFDKLWNDFPHTILCASGPCVGLPKGQMGNSEVGHMTIGAGRVLDQDLVRIDKSILDGEFERNIEIQKLFEHVKKYNSTLHVTGLLSSGGVHSHINHLFSFLQVAKANQINKIAIHVITDGRDTPPQSGAEYVNELEQFISKLGVGRIASVSGRLYAMDRDKRWERFKLAEDVIFNAEGPICKTNPVDYINDLYKRKENESDEYLIPFVCTNDHDEKYPLSQNDGFFLFNFRADRMRMLTKKLLDIKDSKNLEILTMTDYGDDYNTLVAFPPIKTEVTLGKVLSENNLNQVHIAETEKFAHATYFLNCGEEKPYKGEEQILVPSPQGVLTYDLAPKMSAEGVANEAIKQIEKGTNFIFVNFANADMVGHTANVPAIVNAVEEVDKQLGRIIDALHQKGGMALITADHGNAEVNIDGITGKRHTSHTNNPVPLIITNIKGKIMEGGELSDIAPTILNLMNIKKPEEMTGKNLLTFEN